MRLTYFGALALYVAPLVSLANPAHKKIESMSEPARQAFMVKYLNSNGETCPRVDRTFLQGVNANGDAFWNISCRPGKSYLLMIENNARGSTKVIDCAVLKAIKGGICFVKFPR